MVRFRTIDLKSQDSEQVRHHTKGSLLDNQAFCLCVSIYALEINFKATSTMRADLRINRLLGCDRESSSTFFLFERNNISLKGSNPTL